MQYFVKGALDLDFVDELIQMNIEALDAFTAASEYAKIMLGLTFEEEDCCITDPVQEPIYIEVFGGIPSGDIFVLATQKFTAQCLEYDKYEKTGQYVVQRNVLYWDVKEHDYTLKLESKYYNQEGIEQHDQ